MHLKMIFISWIENYPVFLVISFILRTFSIIYGWNFVWSYLVISTASSTIFDPELVRKFMGISNFGLFVIIFGFPTRLVLLPHSIIIIYLKSDLYFFTCFIPYKPICSNPQMLVFVLDTLTPASLFTVFKYPLHDAC